MNTVLSLGRVPGWRAAPSHHRGRQARGKSVLQALPPHLWGRLDGASCPLTAEGAAVDRPGRCLCSWDSAEVPVLWGPGPLKAPQSRALSLLPREVSGSSPGWVEPEWEQKHDRGQDCGTVRQPGPWRPPLLTHWLDCSPGQHPPTHGVLSSGSKPSCDSIRVVQSVRTQHSLTLCFIAHCPIFKPL